MYKLLRHGLRSLELDIIYFGSNPLPSMPLHSSPPNIEVFLPNLLDKNKQTTHYVGMFSFPLSMNQESY